MRALSSFWLLALLLTAATCPALAADPAKPAPLTEEITVIGQRPIEKVTPNTSYWVEDALTSYPLLGPNFAQGLILWNHSDPWDHTGTMVPPVRAMEGMAALGWDIVRLQRNTRVGGGRITSWEIQVDDVAEGLDKQLANAHAEGYKRVILAGQEMGGALALEASKITDGIYAVIAFAPNTGVEWCGRNPTRFQCPNDQPLDYNAQVVLDHTWDQLRKSHPARLFVLFPQDDEQVPHLRGPTARDILNGRRDLPFLLVDETGGVRGNAGADKPEFDAYASCMDLFLSPELTPKPGEFRCGADEVPTALAQMGVKPGAGETWFGYSSRGQTIYLELPANGRGPVIYGWGAGANGKTRPGFKALDAQFAGDTFTAHLMPDQLMHGVRHDPLYRLTIDLEDGTRASVTLHRLSGNS